VTVTFSEKVDPATLTAASFSVTNSSNSGSPVMGTVTCSGATATFTPTSPLPGSATIHARVTVAVTDRAGNPLATEFVRSFMTPDLRFAYVIDSEDDTVSVYGIGPVTGHLDPRGTTNRGDRPSAVCHWGLFAYVANVGAGGVMTYSIDPSTGALTEVGTGVAAGDGPWAMAVHPSGEFAYVANFWSNDVTTFAIDPATGVLTEVGTEVAAGSGP
jgi:6-phosphogluconolactonase (cycloisomerase 2 family)